MSRSTLALCSVCRRHVRTSERVCPFCARAASIVAVAFGTGVALAACGGTTEPGPTDAAADVVDAATAHDAAAEAFVGFDAAPDSTPDAYVPGDGGIALYGAPPATGGQRAKLHE